MSRSTDWTTSLWRDIFNEMLDEDNELDYGDEWTLNFNYNQTDEISKEERKRGWKVCTHCARGNFLCRACHKSWGSARVTVLFRYRLRVREGRGTVIMRPFGQACRSCPEDEFYLPGFSETEVERALLRLFSKIRKNCYGEEDENDGSASCPTKVLTKPHEKALCEACAQGICCQDDDDDD